MHLYSFKCFKKNAPNQASRLSEIGSIPFKYVRTLSANDLGFYNGTCNLNELMMVTRKNIISSSAHEREHAYQHNEAWKYKKLKENSEETNDIKLIEKEDVAEIYLNEFRHYIKSEVDYEAYYNQEVERKARFAASEAVNKYQKSTDFLRDEFMYAPDYLIN